LFEEGGVEKKKKGGKENSPKTLKDLDEGQ